MKTVALIIVHYRTLSDTLECIESALKLQLPEGVNTRLIVIDNASRDGSWEALCLWMESQKSIWRNSPDLINGADEIRECALNDGRRHCTFVLSSQNGGYAGGLNLGIQQALRDSATTHLWLLNSDLLLDQNALTPLLERSDSFPSAIYGSTLLYHDTPSVIQAAGGANYFRLIGRSKHCGKGKKIDEFKPAGTRFDYIVGAAMFVRREVMDQVGFLDHRFYLYFEELEWCRRAQKKGIQLIWVPESRIIHKEGKSTGAAGHFRRLSDFSFRYVVRNSLLYTVRYHPWCLPTVIIYNALEVVRYCLHSDLGKPRVAFQAFKDFLKESKGHLLSFDHNLP